MDILSHILSALESSPQKWRNLVRNLYFHLDLALCLVKLPSSSVSKTLVSKLTWLLALLAKDCSWIQEDLLPYFKYSLYL